MTGIGKEILRQLPYDPNPQQMELVAAFCKFVADSEPRPAFVLNGYDNTGKTSLTSALERASRLRNTHHTARADRQGCKSVRIIFRTRSVDNTPSYLLKPKVRPTGYDIQPEKVERRPILQRPASEVRILGDLP